MKMVAADQPDAPGYFVHDAILNRKDRPSLDDAMRKSLKPLDLAEVLSNQKAGAQVIDVRDAADFAGAHLVGSINIGLDGKYATWCGTILDKDRPIIVVADAEQIDEAVMRLGRIGFDQVLGYLEYGLQSLAPRPDLVAHVDRITAQTVHDWKMRDHIDLTVLDVRTANEWQDGHIARSLNIPLNQLASRMAEIPRDKPILVHCRDGYRSSLATSLLQREGLAEVKDLVGGMGAWNACNLPFVQATRVTA